MPVEIIPADQSARTKAIIGVGICVLVLLSLRFIIGPWLVPADLNFSDNPTSAFAVVKTRVLILLAVFLPVSFAIGIWHLRYALCIWRERAYPPKGTKVAFPTRVRHGTTARAWSVAYFVFSFFSFLAPVAGLIFLLWVSSQIQNVT